jgi:D-serine deaminase-like pyridoxal phosphate-dependent protein
MTTAPENAGNVSALRSLLADLAADKQEMLRQMRTPCLLVDRDALRANTRTATAQAQASGITIRPHVKAHKCSTLLRAQLAGAGVQGVTCATAYEAQALAALHFDDILVANEVVSDAGGDALAAAASTANNVVVAVDGLRGIEVASEAARTAGRAIGVLVDIDVGGGRCGVAADSDAVLELAQLADSSAWLRFDGIMGYTGRANYTATRRVRHELATAVKAELDLVRHRLLSHGLSTGIVSGGSTGLFDLDQGLTEIQMGSYILMEGRYAGVGLPFAPALFCVATVISSSRTGHAVLDCGWKALTAEFGFPLTPPGLEPVAFSDEHLVCSVAESAHFEVGDVVLAIPAHLDPTVNLHERLLVFEDDAVVEWPIDLRRTGPLMAAANATG